MLHVLSGYRTLEVVEKKADKGAAALADRVRVATFFVSHELADDPNAAAALETMEGKWDEGEFDDVAAPEWTPELLELSLIHI